MIKQTTTVNPENSSHRAKAARVNLSSSCRYKKCTSCCGRCIGDFHCLADFYISGGVYGNKN